MTAHGWIEVVPGRVLEVVHGDLTRFAAEAIVSAAYSALAGGGGVDGAVHRVGGPAIIADLEARYGPNRHCPTGSAVVTVAGDLPARWVIHAVGPIWRGGGAGERDLLVAAYRAAMGRAEQLGARSIAFPAITCGIYRYPLDAGAEVGLGTVAEALVSSRSVERATFVLYSRETFDVFARLLRALEPASQG